MKKKFITLLSMIVLSCSLFAQNDAFFSYNNAGGNNSRNTTAGGYIITNGFGINDMNGNVNDYEWVDNTTPLGSGLLILAGAGIAYAFARRKEESK